MKDIIIKLFIHISYLFIVMQSVFSQDDTLKTNLNDLMVIIELANPKIYHQDDEILINVKIYNPSSSDKICIIADDKRFSFDFKMVTMQNRQIEHSNDYSISFHRVQTIFHSNIRLQPGEGYVYQVRLNDYYNLNITGQFFVSCIYYQNLKMNKNNNEIINSNSLTINIRPGGSNEELIAEVTSVEQEKKYYITKRSPDEVIDFTLNARMNEEWEKYFLYIDLEQLIFTNNKYKSQYQKADTERQKEILIEYKEYLKLNSIDGISFRPVKFEILKTEYTAGRAKVDVIEYFKYLDYNEKKYYTYFLNKKGNIWYIASYEVLNIGYK